MSSTGNDFSHCLHGSPIVEKPRFSKDSKSTISSCKSDANKKENPHRHIVDKSRWGRARRVNSMSTPTSCFTNANPMPTKKPPLTSLAKGNGGNWKINLLAYVLIPLLQKFLLFRPVLAKKELTKTFCKI